MTNNFCCGHSGRRQEVCDVLLRDNSVTRLLVGHGVTAQTFLTSEFVIWRQAAVAAELTWVEIRLDHSFQIFVHN